MIKKNFSVLTAVVLLLCFVVSAVQPVFAGKSVDGVWEPDKFEWEKIPRGDDVVARFAMGADIHFGIDSYNADDKLPTVYRALKAFGGVDALCISGDLNHFGREDVFLEFMEPVRKYSSELTVDVDGFDPSCEGDAVGTTIYSMGNHESNNELGDYWARFRRTCGQEPTKLYWVCGVPIVKMSPDEKRESGTYHGQEDEILAMFDEIDKSGYTGPIIGMAHHRTPEKMPKSGENKTWSKKELSCFAAHPNFILFTGHSHTNFYTTREFIEQDLGFTMVRSGVLGIGYGGSYVNPLNGRETDPTFNGSDDVCSFVLMDIKSDGTALLRRVDISKGEFVFPEEDFIVDPSADFNRASEGGKTVSYFSKSDVSGTYGYGSAAPVFPEGAAVGVKVDENHSTAHVTFPAASPASSSARDYIKGYDIICRWTDENGDEQTTTRSVMNDAYLSEQHTVWNVPVVSLEPDTVVTFDVYAINSYDHSSFISSTEPVNMGHLEVRSATPILSVDVTGGSTEDECGREQIGKPSRDVVTEDKTLGKKAMRFYGIGSYAYEFSRDDFNSLRTDYSMEAYFRVADNSSSQIVLGSIDSMNTAFRIKDGKVWLWGSFTSQEISEEARFVVGADIDINKWYHVVSTYDGYKVRLYLNGDKVAEVSAAGGLSDVAFEELSVNIGGGSRFADSYLLNALAGNSYVNLARVYTGVLTDDEVKEAYEKATSKRASQIFRDVEAGAFYEDPVSWAVARGVTAGTGPDTFSPEDGCTRGQVVTFLWRAAGSPEPSGKTNPFRDVGESDYYFKPVLWAVENGITAGTGKTTFSPSDTCTRGQIVTFLWRSSGNPAPSSSSNPFSDVKSGDYFADAVLWAVERSITLGTGKTTFSPSDTCTRGQVVTFLYRDKTK